MKFHKSQDIFDFTKRSGMVKERSDGDQRLPHIFVQGFNDINIYFTI